MKKKTEKQKKDTYILVCMFEMEKEMYEFIKKFGDDPANKHRALKNVVIPELRGCGILECISPDNFDEKFVEVNEVEGEDNECPTKN